MHGLAPVRPATPTSTHTPTRPATLAPFSAGFSEEQVQFASATVQHQVLESLLAVAGRDRQSRNQVRKIAQSMDPSMDRAVRQALNAAADRAHTDAVKVLGGSYCPTEWVREVASSSYRAALPRTLQRSVSPAIEAVIDQLDAEISVEPWVWMVVNSATLSASASVVRQSTRTVVEAIVRAAENGPRHDSAESSDSEDSADSAESTMGGSGTEGSSGYRTTDFSIRW